MKRAIWLSSLAFGFVLTATPVWAVQAEPTKATGVVYHDANNNNQRDADEPGIPDVRVSNGQEVVKTDAQGRYELTVGNEAILFVIKPRDWATQVDDKQIPRFYYVHRPEGSPKSRHAGVTATGELPKSIDFGLRKSPESDQFNVLMFGDTQPRNIQEVDYIAHDVIEPIINANAHDAVFGVTLGDVVFDDLSVFDPLIDAVANIGLPWYNVHGNHDTNQDADGDHYSQETFARIFGPAYYSYDYGPVHFIVVDNINWIGRKQGSPAYDGQISQAQLAFIENDLKHVDKDKLVVLMMHIPLTNTKNREELYRLIEDRPHTLSLSAHTHRQIHSFIGAEEGWKGQEPHLHINHGTVCGSWFSGAPDENRIPHATMSDGTPNGYSVFNFDGNKFSYKYLAARRPADYQLSIHTPEEVAVADLANAEIAVNVFAGNQRSKVEFQVEGSDAWLPLEHTATEDRYYLESKQAEEAVFSLPAVKKAPAGSNPFIGRKLPAAAKSTHIWLGKLPADIPAGTQKIKVRTTDMFGNVYDGTRLIRIVADKAK